jgi:hypothetical protein
MILRQPNVFSIHLHLLALALTHHINGTRCLTAIVNKAFDTRIWSNSLLNHRLWYQCWIKREVWKIIHIRAKTIIHNIFIQNLKTISLLIITFICEIINYSLFQIIPDFYPILAIYQNRYLISIKKINRYLMVSSNIVARVLTCFCKFFPIIHHTENNLLCTTIFSLLRPALFDTSIFTDTSLH